MKFGKLSMNLIWFSMSLSHQLGRFFNLRSLQGYAGIIRPNLTEVWVWHADHDDCSNFVMVVWQGGSKIGTNKGWEMWRKCMKMLGPSQRNDQLRVGISTNLRNVNLGIPPLLKFEYFV